MVVEMDMKRIVYVDIDGVLAVENLPALFALCNRLWHLEISEEQLALIQTEEAFHQMPAVADYRAHLGQERYQHQFKRMYFHPHYVDDMHVIDHAQQGVARLVRRFDELAYCTARLINFHPQWNEHLQRVTRLWLKRHDFLWGDRHVYFCNGIRAKLTLIAERVKQEHCQFWLIDDSLEQLLLAFDELSGEDQEVLQDALTLVAFGHDGCERATPVPVIPFPDWREINNLLVEKEFYHGNRKSTEQLPRL
jgi:hypothetical protein